jgi:hypothetical protein
VSSIFSKSVTPKITFMGSKPDAGAGEAAVQPVPAPVPQPMSTTYAAPAAPGGNVTSSDNKAAPEYVEKDVQPVGQDYIEELRNEEGKPWNIQFV